MVEVPRKNIWIIRALIRGEYKKTVGKNWLSGFVKLDLDDEKIVDHICDSWGEKDECLSCPFGQFSAPECEKRLRAFLQQDYEKDDRLDAILSMFKGDDDV